jgi:hypothetical protein
MISQREVIYVNGQAYMKTIDNDQWQKASASGTASQAASARGETPNMIGIVDNSTKQTNLGEENIEGYQCYHLQFELSPENVKELVPQVSSDELKECTGGTADYWISTDSYYLIKWSVIVRNATDPVVGKTDIQVFEVFSQINQPITITAPI